MTDRLLLQEGNCIDGNGNVFPRTSVLIENGRISRIGRDVGSPPDAVVVPCRGKTVMPGLIDAHVHLCLDAAPDPLSNLMKENEHLTVLKSAGHAGATLVGGVTTVRDAGARQYIDIALRNAVNTGIARGPRIIASGKPIAMTGGSGWFFSREADGEDEARKAAREQIKAGADLLKIMATGNVMTEGVEPGCPQLTVSEMTAAADEARKAGKPVAAHAQGLAGIKNALLAGVNSIEHGIFLDDEAIAMMIEKGAFLVPTLSAPHNIIIHGRNSGIPEYAVKKTEVVMETHLNSFRNAYRAGVRIAMGTDAGTPFNVHGENARELELMVEAGMKPMDAIIAATKTAAVLLDIDRETGSIEQGKKADIIVLAGNPLDNIGLLRERRNIDIIIQNGTIVGGESICSTS